MILLENEIRFSYKLIKKDLSETQDVFVTLEELFSSGQNY